MYMDGGVRVIDEDPRVLKQQDLQDELEIAMLLGRFKQPSPGREEQGGANGARRRRFAEADPQDAAGFTGFGATGHGPRPPPKVAAAAVASARAARQAAKTNGKPPRAATPIAALPRQGSHFTSTATEKVGAVDCSKSHAPTSIGERLYRLGLNPMKRPKGSASGSRPNKSDVRIHTKGLQEAVRDARFHLPKKLPTPNNWRSQQWDLNKVDENELKRPEVVKPRIKR